MDPLTLDELDRESEAFDALVVQTQDIDAFCSSSDWIVPAARALMPRREPFLRRAPGGYIALMRGQHPSGFSFLEPLEAMWGLACPLVGPDPVAIVESLAIAALTDAPGEVLVLCGVVSGAPLFDALIQVLGPSYELRRGPTTKRFVADLSGGLDGFLGRRSANLRGSLKQARRRAAEAGIAFVAHAPSGEEETRALYARIIEVEARSWKGMAGTGIIDGQMRGFYAHMVKRLLRKGALRVMFARHDDRDVAYVLGAVLEGTYRGLQASYDDGYERFSLGSLMHYHQIAELCAEGIAAYDLGSEVDYKRRWGEEGLATITVIGVPMTV